MSNYLKWLEIYQIIMIAAWVVELINQKKGNGIIRYFLVFLSVSLVFEMFFSYYFAKVYRDNRLVLVFYATMCVVYYLYVLNDHFRTKPWATYFHIISGIWLMLATFFLVTDIADKQFDPSWYNVGMGLASILILKYFYDVVYVDEYRNVFREPKMYFFLGILFFFTSSFPLLIKIKFLSAYGQQIGSTFFGYMRAIGNIFLALGYLGAAICNRKI